MTIDELLASAVLHSQDPEQHPTLMIPGDWSQGRTSYGGISAAMVYAAMQAKVTDDRLLRAFNCNFVGPLNVDEPFRIDVEILRQGKSASQVLARAIQNEQVAVLCQASFGVARKSKIKVENRLEHGMSLPKKPKFIPHIPKVTPKFIKQFELAVVEGKLPFMGAKTSHIHGWMRYKNTPASFQDAHLIGLIDAWPPTVLQMLRLPVPASTMSWNIEFIHPHVDLKPTDWFAYQVKTRQAEDGYCHTEADIFDQQGELIAISRQTVAVFG